MRPFTQTLVFCLLIVVSALSIPTQQPVQAADTFEPIPSNLPVITAQNAGRLRRLSTFPLGDFRYIDHRTTFSPDGRLLAFGPIKSGLMTISVLELSTGKQTDFSPKRLAAPTLSLHQQVVFSSDGRLLATSAADGAILIWEVATGKRQARLNQDSTVNFGFSHDGTLLVTIGENKVVRVWDIATGIPTILPVGKPEGWQSHIISRPDGRLEVAFNLCKAGFKIWDVKTGNGEAREPSGEMCTVDVISDDGSRLAAFRSISRYEIWDVDKGQKIADIPFNNVTSLATNGMAFSTDNKLFASLEGRSKDKVILRLWDLDGGKQAAAYEFSDSTPIHSVIFSPDGKLIALEKYDPAVRKMIVELWGAAN